MQAGSPGHAASNIGMLSKAALPVPSPAHAAPSTPAAIVAVGVAITLHFAGPAADLAPPAGINIGWLLAYGVSIIAPWRAPIEEPHPAASA